MAVFNLGRVNQKLETLGERKIILPKIEYAEPKIVNDYLVNEMNKVVGTKGDMYHKKIMHTLLQKGCLDHNPRPKYHDFYEGAKYNKYEGTKFDKYKGIVTTKDGQQIYLSHMDEIEENDKGIIVKVPAHTLSVNSNIECSYDLSKGETPMITLRPIATKTSVAEIIWIYLMQSNDLVEFDKLLGYDDWEETHEIHNWWEEWALRNPDGSYVLNEKGHPIIGSTYGESVRLRDMLYREVINPLKNNPDGRRNICSLWQIDDYDKPHGLKPCAFLTIWNIRHEWDGKDYLDMTLVQRSSDFDTAGCINQVQYVALMKMVAAELGVEPGIFTWKPVNIQIYDRHIEQSIELLEREPIDCGATVELKENIPFDQEYVDNVYIKDYPRELVKKKNPQLKFPIGI